MPKQINGGTIDDDAAEILAKLSKDTPRGEVIATALRELAENKRGSVNIKLVQSAGVLNGSFNWFHNLKFVIAIRKFIEVHLPKLPDETPLRVVWVFGGAAGILYLQWIISGIVR